MAQRERLAQAHAILKAIVLDRHAEGAVRDQISAEDQEEQEAVTECAIAGFRHLENALDDWWLRENEKINNEEEEHERK